MRGSLAKKAMPDEQEQERSRRGEGAVAAASHDWTAGGGAIYHSIGYKALQRQEN